MQPLDTGPEKQAAANAEAALGVLRAGHHNPVPMVLDLPTLSSFSPGLLANALRAGGVSVPYTDPYSTNPSERDGPPAVVLATALMLLLARMLITLPPETPRPAPPSSSVR